MRKPQDEKFEVIIHLHINEQSIVRGSIQWSFLNINILKKSSFRPLTLINSFSTFIQPRLV